MISVTFYASVLITASNGGVSVSSGIAMCSRAPGKASLNQL